MCNDLSPFLTRFFNVSVDSGIISLIWCEGIIVLILKNGDPNETDNCKVLPLWVACWKYLLLYLIKDLSEEQFGLRPGVGTVDKFFDFRG